MPLKQIMTHLSCMDLKVHNLKDLNQINLDGNLSIYYY